MYWIEDMTRREALRLAKHFAVKRPGCGWEVCLGNEAWLTCAGHYQLGSYGLSDREKAKPFTARFRTAAEKDAALKIIKRDS